MRKLFTLAASALLILSQSSFAAPTYKPEYKLSTVLSNAFPWGKAGERWAELVRERTQGRINIKMYPGASLVGGDQTKEFSAIRQGVIDLAIGSSINWSPQVKQLNLFSLPFFIPDNKALDTLLTGEIGTQLFGVLEKNGVVPLAWGENGFRELSNAKLAIKSPEDLKGLKIRIVGSPIFIDYFTALGANPTQMSWADTQAALATNAVDGQENPLSIFSAAKLHSLGQKHLSLWDYMVDPLIFVVNKDVWLSWSPQDQEAVRAAARQAAAENRIAARKGITPEDNELLKAITANGVTITWLTPEQRKAFKDAAVPVVEKWSQQIGVDLVKKAESVMAGKKP